MKSTTENGTKTENSPRQVDALVIPPKKINIKRLKKRIKATEERIEQLEKARHLPAGFMNQEITI
jgi:hypothetical protein